MKNIEDVSALGGRNGDTPTTRLAACQMVRTASAAINERALQHARMIDGKLLLVTNAADLSPRDVVDRYK